MAINLKQEINRTIELKNKLTVSKNNINKVIVRGGGKQSQTLEEIAGNIEGMVRQYKKMATGTIYQRITSSSYTINTNTSFQINDAIVFIRNINQVYGTIGIRVKNFNSSAQIWTDYGKGIKLSLKIQNKNQILINMLEGEGYFIESWLAINQEDSMLKETIDKTRELTNNVKIAKNEINDAIVRGGVYVQKI